MEIDGNSPPPPPTYPLDVSAALTSDGKFLTVAIVNPTESAHQVDLAVKGADLRGRGRIWHMTGPNLDAVTGLTRHEVQVPEAQLSEVPKTIKVAPLSIDLYEFERR